MCARSIFGDPCHPLPSTEFLLVPDRSTPRPLFTWPTLTVPPRHPTDPTVRPCPRGSSAAAPQSSGTGCLTATVRRSATTSTFWSSATRPAWRRTRTTPRMAATAPWRALGTAAPSGTRESRAWTARTWADARRQTKPRPCSAPTQNARGAARLGTTPPPPVPPPPHHLA